MIYWIKTEMNIFSPRSIQTQVELREIAAVDLQFIHPSVSKSSIGIVQDGLIGIYNLTSPTVKIDWKTAMNLMSYTTVKDSVKIPKTNDIDGSSLYSMVIPNSVNLTTDKLKIKKGKITEGRVTTKNLGFKERNTLIQLIWDEYGKNKTENFIDDTQKLANNYNLWYGFSVGYGDLERPAELINQVNVIFETKVQEMAHLVTEIENNPGLMKKELLESHMYNKLKAVNEEVQKLSLNTLSEHNAFKVMQTSGSKGKADNVGQMIGCLGLQGFEGKLIPKNYNGRTSPYYHINDDSAVSRGLTNRSFADGLEWPDFVYQMLNGRSGSIDSAVRTSETGYLQRKLIKSLEDVMVKYDGTIRNANENVIQFVYGDSGANSISQFEYEISSLEMNNEQLERNHKFTSQELANFADYSQQENDEFYNNIKDLRDEVRKRVQRAEMKYITKKNAFMLPINFVRIIEDINEIKETKSKASDLSPKYIIDKLNELLTNEKTPLVPMTQKERNDPNSFKNMDERAHKTVFKLALYNVFSPKRMILEYMLSKEKFDQIIDYIVLNFEKNIIEPGEAVGIIAASAAGEPLTQMNLNSFHQSSVARMTSTVQGVPRMKEIFSVSKNLRTPQMTIYLAEGVRKKKEVAHKISSNLKHTTFGEIRERINIYYDPNPTLEEGLTAKDNIIPTVFTQKGNKGSCQQSIAGLPWLLRIEINREKMAEKEITLLDIASQFCNWWSNRFIDAKNVKKEERRVLNKINQMAILSNADNDKEQIIHIRFNSKDNDKDKFDLDTIHDFVQYILDEFKLKGINGIKKINSETEERYVVFDKETGEVKSESEYVIYASGVNLTEIRYLLGIDLKRTISNDIVQIYNTFGIEMARSVLLKEITEAYSTQGAPDVNYQHIEIIVDQMTYTGSINSIDRHGLSKSDADPLSRASFERPVEQLWSAAVFGESDNMKGISARIMAGQVGRVGTGICDLLLNVDMIERAEYVETAYDKKYIEIRTDNVADDIMNKNEEDENMFMPM